MSCKPIQASTPVIPLIEARRFIADCMMAVGTPKTNAEILADNMVTADHRGHYCQGMDRLEMYIQDVEKRNVEPEAEPTILKETPATAWVSGNRGLGAVVGKFCMGLAMKKAKEVGIGWVVVKESSHYGIASVYTIQATRHGLVGMALSNTSPLLAPTRAKTHALGTNPISVGAPGNDLDEFMLDMSTTAVDVTKIEMHIRRNQTIPEGWALDGNGHVTTDAKLATLHQRLMPLGGTELNSGYKGYGLATMVEVLTGILSGSSYGPKIRKWGDSSVPENLGQCFVAIDPKCFAPGFEDRLSGLMHQLRNLAPISPAFPVQVAGDPEKSHMQIIDKQGGLRYYQEQYEVCSELAKRLKVKPLRFLL